jgi:hypothetical protein
MLGDDLQLLREHQQASDREADHQQHASKA